MTPPEWGASAEAEREVCEPLDLDALAEEFAAQERADRRAATRRRRQGLPEPPRRLSTFEGFASGPTPVPEEE